MPKRTVPSKLQPCIRWTVIVILSLSSFAYYYSYDIPVSLQKQYAEYYNLSGITYCLIYSMSSYPNAILPFFNGIIANKIGFNRCLLLSFGIIVIGHITTYCSLLLKHINYGYLMLLLGRLLYGIGSESFLMLITPTIYLYFKNKELSLSLSLYFTLSRIGTAAVLLFSSYYFQNNPQNEQNMISFLVLIGLYIFCGCYIFLICLIIYRIYSTQHVLRAHTMTSVTSADVWNTSNTSYDLILENDINAKAKLLADNNRQLTYDTNNNIIKEASAEINDDLTSMMFSSILPTNTTTYTSYIETENVINTKFNFNDIKSFNIRYWFLILNCCLITGTILPFINIGSSYLQNMYNFKQFDSNLLLMIPIILCCIFTPIFSIFIEKYGGRCQWLLLSSIILTISHYILGFIEIGINTSHYPIIALCGIGIAYSSFSSVIWSSFALVVDLKLLPTAYCIQASIYNTIIPTFYIIIGILTKDNNQLKIYENVNLFLLLLSVFSIITVCLLWYLDEKYIRKNMLHNDDCDDMSFNYNGVNNDKHDIDSSSALLMSAYITRSNR